MAKAETGMNLNTQLIDDIFSNFLQQHEGPDVSETFVVLWKGKIQTSISAISFSVTSSIPQKTAMIHTKHPSTTTFFISHPYNHKASDSVVSFIKRCLKRFA